MEKENDQDIFMAFLKMKKNPDLKQKDGISIRFRSNGIEDNEPIEKLNENDREIFIKQLIKNNTVNMVKTAPINIKVFSHDEEKKEEIEEIEKMEENEYFRDKTNDADLLLHQLSGPNDTREVEKKSRRRSYRKKRYHKPRNIKSCKRKRTYPGISIKIK